MFYLSEHIRLPSSVSLLFVEPISYGCYRMVSSRPWQSPLALQVTLQRAWLHVCPVAWHVRVSLYHSVCFVYGAVGRGTREELIARVAQLKDNAKAGNALTDGSSAAEPAKRRRHA